MWLSRPERRNRPQKKNMGRLLRRTLLILTLLLAVPAASFGKGQVDGALSRADELIAEKRYNEALAALIPFARENSRDFDAVQERIHQILFIKDQYNTAAQDLLNELESEEPRDEEIVRLTNLLFELDPQRIAETQDFITRTRDVAMFKSNQRRLARIMGEGQTLAEEGSYTEAIRAYTEGFTIYQAEFFSGTYGAQLENRARAGIANVNSNMAGVTDAANALEAAVNALASLSGQGADAQNLVNYRNAYNRLAAEMDRFTALRNTFAATGAVFQQDLTQLRQNFPREGDRNFLAFAVRLMEGSSDTSSGILGVFNIVWNREIPRARVLLEQKSQTVYAAAVADASGRNYGNLAARAEVLDGYASFPENLEIRWGTYETAQKTTLFNQPVSEGEAANYLKFRALAGSSSQWGRLGELGSRYLAVPAGTAAAAVPPEGEDVTAFMANAETSSSAIRQIRTEAEALAGAIERGSADYRTLETSYPNSGSLTYINGVNQAALDLINLLNSSEEEAAVYRYTIANRMLEARTGAREAEFREGSVYFQGTQRGEYLAKYPTMAAETLTRMDGALAADREAAQSLMRQYGAESAAVGGGARVSALRAEAAAITARLESAQTQGRTMAAAARSQSMDAANLRREGDRLLTETRAALTRNDFNAARNNIERAGNAYFQSLEREDDQATRNSYDTELPALDDAIAVAFNQEVLRQVEELVGQIRDSYFRSEFDDAEELVSRAQNIWRQTQTGENPDLAYWQGMILAGIRSGRTIPPTAPLYAEMSQLLSDARKNFNEGQISLVDSQTEGRRKLVSAKTSLEKVKLVYPMNEEAGILDLRIDQLLDPNFSGTLRGKIDAAVLRTKSGSSTGRIQALNELRDYRSVFPDFIAWAALIYQAEVDAGLRPPPPTQAQIEEAAAIVAAARPIVASGNVNNVSGIQDELSRAVRLNPNNQEARNLFAEAARIVQRGNLMLDFEAERLFQQASQALTQQNPMRAQMLLREIYARNSDYRYIAKVITVQQRADSML